MTDFASLDTGPTPRTTVAPLVVENLSVTQEGSDTTIVDEVSFELGRGEFMGLVGESGSGKTTVGMAVLGYVRRGLRIAAGRVAIDGTAVLGLSDHQLERLRGKRVAYVPQDPASALNPAHRVGPQIREVLLGRHADDEPKFDVDGRVAELLTEASLDRVPDILRRYPHQLSGGQQQRVVLAMAFAWRPSVIVLDEPTTGLDVTTQRHILQTVRRLCQAHGTAGVYVSHDLATVASLVSKVAVMYSGRIVEYGAMSAVFGAAGHPYTQALLRSVPSPDSAQTLEGIGGQPPRPDRRPLGCSFSPRCRFAEGICRERPPPVSHLADGREVRCFRASTVLSATKTSRPGRVATKPLHATECLSVVGLSANYGAVRAVVDATLSVPAHGCVAVVGESGSGKTTLARSIVGLHEQWDGEVRLQGEPLSRGAKARSLENLRLMQYVFQNPYASLNPRKTVGQAVEEPLRWFFSYTAPQRLSTVCDVLDSVALGRAFINLYPDQLSGGERQRVAIARALIVQPAVLVCDEITSALDVSVQAVITELLRSLQREMGLGMVFITHNIALARTVAESVIVMSEGRVVEAGPVNDVLDSPNHPYTVRLLEDIPRLRLSQLGPAIPQP